MTRRRQQTNAGSAVAGTDPHAARVERAHNAACAMHAKHDPSKTTAKARTTLLARIEQQVDPNGTLPEWKRAIRATAARKLHYTLKAYARWNDNPPPACYGKRGRRCCNFHFVEQGQSIPAGYSGRACRRHQQEWRINSLRYLMEHGGDTQQALLTSA